MKGSPNPAISTENVKKISESVIEAVDRMMQHVNSQPILNHRDLSETRASAKLGLEVVEKMTTDPFLMANIVKNMSDDRVSTLDDWILATKRLSK